MQSQLRRGGIRDRKFVWSRLSSRGFATGRSVLSSELRFEVIPQSDRIVVLTVVRTVDKCDRPSACSLQDRIAHFRMSFQFGSIKLPKLFPFLGIMTEPLAQFGTGRNILQPGIETERGFLHAARP